MLLEGRFADAEAHVLAVGDVERAFLPADAGLVMGTQLMLLRREQGRGHEMEPVVRDLSDRFPTVPGLRAMLALLRADLGRLEEARSELARFAAPGLEALPREFNWMACLVALAETSALLDDAPAAERIYALLRPCAPRAVLVGAGTACLGALDRALGMLAATCRDWEGAARHFDAALTMNASIGATPWVGWTEYGSAWALARRGRAADRGAACRHLARARAIAAALGMVLLERCAAAVAARIE
jgi:hypothetical protein